MAAAGSCPMTQASAPYTQHLKGIQEIIFQGEGKGDTDQWLLLKDFNVKWGLKNEVPKLEDLLDFKKDFANSRSVIIDQDVLSKKEKDTLEQSQLPIIWIHQAP